MTKFFQPKRGFTLVEMLVTLAVLAVLATAVMPIAKIAVKREKEIELHRNLRLIREAIDAYKKLETLVKGVELKADKGDEKGKKSDSKTVKFLRRIPKDPMTDSFDWGLRSYQDEPDSEIWGGENVYDIYTRSLGTALDGTKYRDW
jgi:general secretion pathway protein G